MLGKNVVDMNNGMTFRYYYNIDNEGPSSKDYTMRKEWYMGGCGLDLNYSDSSSGESICKDKYPGLCEKYR